MSHSNTDIVLINPGDRKQVYQGLGADLAAVEPPFWVAVIASYLRSVGFTVAIIDANAENITPSEVAERVRLLAPLLAAVIVYGSQPSASTQNMPAAERICSVLKERTTAQVAIGGLHPSALPEHTILTTDADYVIEGEGPLTLSSLLRVLKSPAPDLASVPGLWYRGSDGSVHHTLPAPLINDLDTMLPTAAWDLLSMDKYRAHNWHCFDDVERRTPYGAIYTSLGCPFNCVFCCINAPFGKPGIRYRSPQRVLEEVDILVTRYGVKNLKIVDELFVLDERHYLTITDLLIQRGYGLNIWAYARVDTVNPAHLERMKRAGINWLALGIESANPAVRDGAAKKMRVTDITRTVRTIQAAGIRVIGNYIFGLPDDTLETMQETLDMATELNCEFANFYCAMAYPGSKLYEIALAHGWQLPESWSGYSQHAYDCRPLPSNHLAAADILKFRDDAFHHYFANPAYLEMIETKFGSHVRSHIEAMSATRLRRKLIGD
ncbi:radical SAM protein [Geobacter sp.]|uniref:B12-binding domain-containing radical SAM protein n=1 Tax=Geobacter sp. TaxID=46610 RepID=UPI002635C1C5|nr:radical SAM protein [Geobacter sp.]